MPIYNFTANQLLATYVGGSHGGPPAGWTFPVSVDLSPLPIDATIVRARPRYNVVTIGMTQDAPGALDTWGGFWEWQDWGSAGIAALQSALGGVLAWDVICSSGWLEGDAPDVVETFHFYGLEVEYTLNDAPTCTEGYRWDPDLQACVVDPPVCPIGSTWNPATARCEWDVEPPVPPVCPAGYHYDAVSRTCVPDTVLPYWIVALGYLPPSCEGGWGAFLVRITRVGGTLSGEYDLPRLAIAGDVWSGVVAGASAGIVCGQGSCTQTILYPVPASAPASLGRIVTEGIEVDHAGLEHPFPPPVTQWPNDWPAYTLDHSAGGTCPAPGAPAWPGVCEDGAVSLSWDAHPAAIGYTVERRVPGGQWTTVAADIADTAYVDAPVTVGQAYHYRLRYRTPELLEENTALGFLSSPSAFIAVTPCYAGSQETPPPPRCRPWEKYANRGCGDQR